MCELWPSDPHVSRNLSAKPSSPGRPTKYMTSLGRSALNASCICSANVSSTWSQLQRSHSPDPRGPLRRCGYRIRSGSLIWLIVAGPFAQLRPRLPGWCGLPSSLRISNVSRSTNAVNPQAASQLKQTVGTIMYSRGTF